MNRFILIMAIGLEGAALWAFVLKSPGGLFFLAHSSSVLCMLLHLIRSYRIDQNPALFRFALWTFVPIFGALCVCFSLTVLKFGTSEGLGAVQDVIEHLESEEVLLRGLSRQTILSAPSSEGENSVIPFVDLLRSGDFNSKKKIISRFRHLGTKEAIRLLRLAQKDPSYDVQYLCTAALVAIEQEWHDEIHNLTHEINQDPTDVKLRNEIVSSYMRIYGSELFSENIETIYFEAALEHATVCLSLAQDDPDILVHVGKVYLALGNFRKAHDAFSKAVQLKPCLPAYQFWKAESSYFLQDYDSLREGCRQLIREEGLHSKLVPVVQFWGGGKEVA